MSVVKSGQDGEGNTATVEFANERTEPGRSGYRKPMELDRVARSESLLSGQAELMQQVNRLRQQAGMTALAGGIGAATKKAYQRRWGYEIGKTNVTLNNTAIGPTVA
jgi:hypothetical protein